MNKEKAYAFAAMISKHTEEPIFLSAGSLAEMRIRSTTQLNLDLSVVVAVFWRGQKIWEAEQ